VEEIGSVDAKAKHAEHRNHRQRSEHQDALALSPGWGLESHCTIILFEELLSVQLPTSRLAIGA
jgi:hypothetical protein